ncbi:phosphopentomutase/phosphoglucosamine mutase [Halalkalicoccus jeotgali]|uniref:Phosphoglucosamine mutase n=1 Tax=Halalkalicoccus jeotgali (strain DSM 18796 / CECT 7217 / JCM 14584 / KCTC 4019 / B3) TaxID=795797 RepID=D8J4X6_HALJB|nr:phosphopentomutase/phosphoglucosamine mutase [Halalkalicoccus jeotgali]ADJ15593.1 Phosphoglucosamine mutase [Halalkalicoccus jeotgali B3]ELY36329.1 phosphoglucosamine mutase [Halalkalicoccus jeotgali B3]
MIRFGTAGIRGPTREEVTPATCLTVGQAVGEGGMTVVLGRDGRETGPALADAMAAGLQSAGADVIRLGVVPTPTVAFASQGRHGVMLTASHNPPADNGIKLFADGVEYDRGAERRIEDTTDDGTRPANWDAWGESIARDVRERYRTAVVEYTREFAGDADGLRVAVDCGNGMAGLATPQVLSTLGAQVTTLNANVDGHFPGRGSKPTPETLADLRAFVEEGSHDLGIGHDGDADRIVIVDSAGTVVHEDTILAILAERYTRTGDVADPVVVTTPNASARIDERVEAAGGRVERVRLGALHEGIARVREAGGDVVFAAEPWKHIHPEFGGWIDGVTSAAVLAGLVAEAGGIDSLREPVTERPYRKVAVECPDRRKEPAMDRLETALPEAFPEAAVDTAYGVRLEWPDGSWLLVRPSGTEPYVRLYAESEDVEALVADASAVIESATRSPL